MSVSGTLIPRDGLVVHNVQWVAVPSNLLKCAELLAKVKDDLQIRSEGLLSLGARWSLARCVARLNL